MEKGDWGKCNKCGNSLDMDYDKWCPSCEIPEPENRQVYNFFRTARYIARQEKYNEGSWENKVLDCLLFPSNDCFIEAWPGYASTRDHPPELIDYYTGLVNHFDIKDDEKIILEISW